MREVEVEIRGHKVMVAEHMLSDFAKFGVTPARHKVKETPKELLKMPEPKALTEQKTIITPQNPLPKMENSIDAVIEKKPLKRKAPVKSKSTK